MEQDIDIKKKVGKDGKEYSNINLKDLEYGNFVIVEKLFPEGLKFPSKFGGFTYSMGVKYKDEMCSFWLNAKQNTLFKDCGIVGDKIKITAKEERAINTKTKVTVLYKAFDFEKV